MLSQMSDDMFIACRDMFMFLFCYLTTEKQPAPETRVLTHIKSNICASSNYN